jgi:hypothetical protein
VADYWKQEADLQKVSVNASIALTLTPFALACKSEALVMVSRNIKLGHWRAGGCGMPKLAIGVMRWQMRDRSMRDQAYLVDQLSLQVTQRVQSCKEPCFSRILDSLRYELREAMMFPIVCVVCAGVMPC